MNFRNKKIIIFLAILAVLNVLAWIAVFDLSGSKLLSVNFLDVGQGDAVYIETPQRHQILIDGGPDSKILEKLGKYMPFYDRSIDLIILSHPEKDHMAGLIEVLKRYKVDYVLWTGVRKDTAEFEEFAKLLNEKGIKTEIAKAGQKIMLGKAELETLYPFESLEGKTVKDANDTSIVSKLVFMGDSFLFTGDISKTVEKYLAEREIDIASDFLKVSHHGSKNSDLEEFIKKIMPHFAVISAGKNNSYGHPHAEVLETLEKFGINILRTDLSGDIKIISNGESF